MIDPGPLWLTAKLALITTFILFLLSIPLSYWLAYTKMKGKTVIEAIVSMPLVLPPSVLGFYLLLAFSPSHSFGKFLENYFDVRLVLPDRHVVFDVVPLFDEFSRNGVHEAPP